MPRSFFTCLALWCSLLGSSSPVSHMLERGDGTVPARRALFLGVARTGALLVAIGAVLVFVFGLWLVDLRGHSLGETWIIGALTLFVLALVLGALGGRRPRQARLLAGQLARNDDAVSPELRRLLEDRASAVANHAAVVAVVAILALMVWQPS
jgi:uncharacterized membrane protein